VMLSVADGPARALDVPLGQPLAAGGSAFILHPDPAPADKYDVSLTVQAFNATNTLMAIGSETMTVTGKGCNRLVVHLAALPTMPAGSDMAACIGALPDEDSDGRANSCDVCPADPDPTPADTDGDGLPDACDPDPGTGGNHALYFDPFDVATGHWSGSPSLIDTSFLNLDTQGLNVLLSNNATDSFAVNVRVQASIFIKAIYTPSNFADTGLYVGTNANPGSPEANGVLCTLTYHGGSGNDNLEIMPVSNGTLGGTLTSPLPFVSTRYRLRVTQRGNTWTCDATASGLGSATVMLTKAVAGPLFMSLRAENMESHFHSVVAESALP
jgi:hypothetical protein